MCRSIPATAGLARDARRAQPRDGGERFVVVGRPAPALLACAPTATAPMGGEQDPWAVVDSLGAVRGVDALRVVDASIIPDVPSVAINPTTIMIAERIAKVV